MFGGQELLIVLVIALLLFGGKNLPEVGRNLGKAFRSFRQAEEETRSELEKTLKEAAEEEKKPEEAEEGKLKQAVEDPSKPESKEGKEG